MDPSSHSDNRFRRRKFVSSFVLSLLLVLIDCDFLTLRIMVVSSFTTIIVPSNKKSYGIIQEQSQQQNPQRRTVWSMTKRQQSASSIQDETNNDDSSHNNNPKKYFVGFDLGTSGARISVITEQTEPEQSSSSSRWNEVYTGSVTWSAKNEYDDPSAWMDAIYTLFEQLKEQSDTTNIVPMKDIQSISFSGTSASCLLVQPGRVENNNDKNQPAQRPIDKIQPSQKRDPKARMYNYNVQDNTVLDKIKQYAPARHTVISTTSSLAKLVLYSQENPVEPNEYFCHQADYVAHQFIERTTTTSIASDWHNCLKLGFDVKTLQYPTWLQDCCKSCNIPISSLPNPIVSPGQGIGRIRADIATYLGLSPTTIIVAGTTDSNAAFFAATADATSDNLDDIAVTSLGSTLAIKQVSSTYVEDADRGIYSHRYPSTLVPTDDKTYNNTADDAMWLVGGASNVGCAILRKLAFSTSELQELSKSIDPNVDSPYQYYPLLKPGERFPISDPKKEPIVEPIPESRRDYLHGLLQSIALVERDGFQALQNLGCNPPTQILSSGGGAQNPMWIQMRQRIISQQSQSYPCKPIDVSKATNVEASYGAAILAAAGYSITQKQVAKLSVN